MKRRATPSLVGLVVALSILVGDAGVRATRGTAKHSSVIVAATAAGDPLLFPKEAFSVETRTVRTSKGERSVTFRSYKHIPHVAKPVDKDYQSLDVSVPVAVDGAAVDATDGTCHTWAG